MPIYVKQGSVAFLTEPNVLNAFLTCWTRLKLSLRLATA